jgi:DNA repair photolyase
MTAENLITALVDLEKRAGIYIERHPRLWNDSLRSDIGPTDVIYFGSFPSIKRKTLLYQTKVEYGDHTINHVLGCAHGCTYPCYAMQMSVRYGRVRDYYDWMHPRLVSNTMDLLENELSHPNHSVKFVHLSFMTDPFMYDAVNRRTYPPIQDLTLRIIRRLNESDIKVTVLTKGLLPESLKEPEYSKDNEYGITLVSTDDDFHGIYEPYSAPASERLRALNECHKAHLKTWVSLEPYPTPNLVKQDLSELLQKVSFVDKMIFGRWNYSPEVNGHEGAEKFYGECSAIVTKFCRKNDIALHIKQGTPMSTTKTNGLFHED